jgi:hypothetical protein
VYDFLSLSSTPVPPHHFLPPHHQYAQFLSNSFTTLYISH